YKLVFDFANPVSNVSSAVVSSGTGSISSASIQGGNYVVNLTGVTNAQKVTVTLTGVSDSAGNSVASLSVTMGVLLGDTNANKAVTSSDVSLVKAQVGASVTSANFRNDVNANGAITSSDVSATKAQVGTTLP